MRIRFASPLAKRLGAWECTIDAPQPLTVDEVVAILAGRFAHTEVFRDGTADGFVPYVWMAFKNGRYLLNPDDRLDDSDELEFIPPIMGG